MFVIKNLYHFFKKVALVTILLFSTNACMPFLIKMAYNNADDLVLYKIDSYFDINEQQEKYLKPRLASLLLEHRQDELPYYIKTFDSLEKRIARGWKKEDTVWGRKRLHNIAIRLYRRTQDSTAVFLSTLSAKQIKYFEKAIEESNEDLEESLEAGLAKQHKKRIEKYLEGTSDWLGNLNMLQEKTLLEKLHTIPNIAPMRLAVRKNRQEILLSGLRVNTENNKQNQKRLKKLLNDLSPQYYATTVPAKYKNTYQANRKFFQEYLLTLAKIATPKQQKHLREKLKGYREIIYSLKL